MKNSTKYIIFGGAIALIGGAYYFMFHKKDDSKKELAGKVRKGFVKNPINLNLDLAQINTEE